MFEMIKDIENVRNTIQGWDATQEEILLSRQLLSNIEKCGDRISITFTGKGACALIKAIQVNSGIVEENPVSDNDSSEDALLSKQDVKDKLSVSDTTLWLWAKKNYLVPVKIGRRVMYRMADIKKIIGG